MIHVLDTHTIVWALEDSARLSAAAKHVLMDPNSTLVVPSIVLAEIWHLHQRRPTKPSMADALASIARLANCVVQSLDEEVLRHLPVGLGIHDAIIVATALLWREVHHHDVRLVTCDQAIQGGHWVEVLW